MEYGGYNVSEKYSSIVAPNFYFDAIFQPGMTFNDQYQGDAEGAGAVKVFRLAAKAAKDPKKPASDFEHGTAGNELISVLMNNSQQESTKIYNVQASAVPFDTADAHLAHRFAKKGGSSLVLHVWCTKELQWKTQKQLQRPTLSVR